jgi:hypothetical protein
MQQVSIDPKYKVKINHVVNTSITISLSSTQASVCQVFNHYGTYNSIHKSEISIGCSRIERRTDLGPTSQRLQ